MLNASIAIVFPFRSEISISFRGMISDIWTPIFSSALPMFLVFSCWLLVVEVNRFFGYDSIIHVALRVGKEFWG